MKLVFTKLETPATEIKVAFDGVNYKSYNVDEIKTNGYIQFTEEECPDLTKVKIQGKFSTLGSVEVNKAIELECGEGGESGISCTFERDVFEEKEVTYYCFAYDADRNGGIDDDDIDSYGHCWLKGEISSGAEPFWPIREGFPSSVNELESAWNYNPNTEVLLIDENTISGFIDLDNPPSEDSEDGGQRWLRYPEGDLIETEKVKVGTETVTEVITEIQDEPTITENGQTIADEGKAFKSVNVKSGISWQTPEMVEIAGSEEVDGIVDDFSNKYKNGFLVVGTVDRNTITFVVNGDNQDILEALHANYGNEQPICWVNGFSIISLDVANGIVYVNFYYPQ